MSVRESLESLKALTGEYCRESASCLRRGQESNTHLIELDRKIQQLAGEILRAPSSDEDNETCLKLVRTTFSNAYTITEGRLYLNLIHKGSMPNPKCETYPLNIQAPFLSRYQELTGDGVIARISPELCKELIPPQLIRDLGGDICSESTDLFLIVDPRFTTECERVVDKYYGKHYKTASDELLVRFHRWLFPALKSNNMKKDPLMGMYEPVNFYKAQHSPIAIDHMAPMHVHAHDGLYSPNGSHIAVDTSAPYSTGWIACRDGERKCITRIISNTMDRDMHAAFPCAREYFSLHEGTRNLEDYLTRIADFSHILNHEIHIHLAPLAELIQKNIPTDAAIKKLPLFLQKNIYKNIWIIKGSMVGIHHDFGNLSFNQSGSIDSKYWATSEEKMQAITLTHRQIVNDLIDLPTNLLRSAGKSITSLDRHYPIANLLRLAEELKKSLHNPQLKIEIFNQIRTEGKPIQIDGLKVEHKLFSLIYQCYEENALTIAGYKKPRHPKFGEAAFFGKDNITIPEVILEMAINLLKTELEKLI